MIHSAKDTRQVEPAESCDIKIQFLRKAIKVKHSHSNPKQRMFSCYFVESAHAPKINCLCPLIN